MRRPSAGRAVGESLQTEALAALGRVIPTLRWLAISAAALVPTALFAQPIAVERLGHLCPGGCYGLSVEAGTVAVGTSKIYFSADDGEHGMEPWVYDTQTGEMLMLADVQPGIAQSGPRNFVAVGDNLFFTPYTPAGNGWYEGRRLWRSDGTPAGTFAIDFPVPPPKQGNAQLVHATSRGVLVHDLKALWWVDVNGVTPSHVLDTDLLSEPVESRGSIFFVAGSCFYCAGDQTPRLYRFDPPSTVTNIGPVALPAATSLTRYYVELAATPGGVAFVSNPGELWASDGIASPTLIRQFPPVYGSVSVFPSLTSAGRLLFEGTDDAGVRQIFATDGTSTGTNVATRFPGAFPQYAAPLLMGVAGDQVVVRFDSYFPPTRIYDYPDAPGYPLYPELWVIDPADPDGARPIRSVAPPDGQGQPRYVASVGGRILFTTRGNLHGSSDYIWISDGTTGGSNPIELAPAPPSYIVYAVVGAIGDTVYATNWSPPYGYELVRFQLPAGIPMSYATAEVTEYFHPVLVHYFMTADPAEKAALDAGIFKGWARTGFGYTAYRAGSHVPRTSPVCRFYGRPEAGLDSHFYSASPQECAEVAARYPYAWILESTDVFEVELPDPTTGICRDTTGSLYRAFNQRADVNHRYSIQAFDQKAMQTKGWLPEGYTSAGIVMCVPSVRRP